MPAVSIIPNFSSTTLSCRSWSPNYSVLVSLMCLQTSVIGFPQDNCDPKPFVCKSGLELYGDLKAESGTCKERENALPRILGRRSKLSNRECLKFIAQFPQ
jgi:hypothetical protein